MRNKDTDRKILKINRMTDAQLRDTIIRLESGQTHTYTNKEGNEVTKTGAPHTTSKYFQHLATEMETRVNRLLNQGKKVEALTLLKDILEGYKENNLFKHGIVAHGQG